MMAVVVMPPLIKKKKRKKNLMRTKGGNTPQLGCSLRTANLKYIFLPVGTFFLIKPSLVYNALR